MVVETGDVVRATVEMSHAETGVIQNVFHLRDVEGEATDVQALADIVDILETLYTLIGGIISLIQVVSGVRAVNVTKDTDIGFGLFVDSTPFVGAGQTLPSQICGGLNLHTGELGVVGRKYFGVPIVGLCDEVGHLTAGAFTILGNAGGYMTDLIEAPVSDWEFGVLTSVLPHFAAFQSYSIPVTAITQRRRRDGVGI